ncbi:MAG: Hvo_1808 family surface protein [Haloarculaceae archaeon]
MQRRGPRAVVVAVALTLLVLAAVPAVTGAAGEAPPDPQEDEIGWENGYWYNESVSVTRADGLNESELDAVVARSMARVEYVRGLEFEETVPVEVISRETFREQLATSLDNTSDEQTMHSSVVLEAMLMLGENESSKTAQQNTLGSGVLGQYDPANETIQIVSENVSTPKMDEITLSQELFHALQDQHFGLDLDANTTDGHNGHDGIVEGDGNYVDHLYQQRCERSWVCLGGQDAAGGGGGSDDIHYGFQLTLFQPYSDGPPFVEAIFEEDGWDGVNAVYDRPPQSSEQVIHPGAYRSDPPVRVSVEDTSDEAWEVLQVPDQEVNYDTVGEGGMAVMTLYPYWASDEEVRLGRLQEFVNVEDGQIDQLDPYDYEFEETAGWGGDRIYPYVREDSFETNETGYVWKTVWDTEEDAREFREEYYELLAIYGAEPVENRLGTFRIPEGEFLADAFYVNHTGKRVTIVNAPTEADLSKVRAGAAPTGKDDLSGTPWNPEGNGTSSDTTAVTGTPAGSDGSDGENGSDSEGGSDAADGGSDGSTDRTGGTDGNGSAADVPSATTHTDGPGFGVLAVALALALVAVGTLARHRGRE